MNITKKQVKEALGVTTDTALAKFFDRKKQQIGQYQDDEPLPRILQLELKANHKSLFNKIINS